MAGPGIAPMRGTPCVFVRPNGKEVLTCPHCRHELELEAAGIQEGSSSMVCSYCEHESLLVRIVSVLHQAVRRPGELLTLLGLETPPSTSTVTTPAEVFSLPVSRGSVLLLAMMWNLAEQTESTRIRASVSELARRLLAERGVVRGWLKELVTIEALRELSGPRESPRVWELLPIPAAGEEVGRG